MSNPENTKESPLSEKKPVKKAKEHHKAPEPTATGDDKITILKHDIYRKGEEAAGVELAIKNVSGTMIGIALFEAIFYDKKGNTLDTVEYKMVDLLPDVSRTLPIISSDPERNKIESYSVRLVKTIIPPTPTATGNDKITILKHKLFDISTSLRGPEASDGADLVIRNVSDTTIARAIFEAVFYDIEGNIMDTVEHKEVDLKPRTSRAILIFSPTRTRNKIKSYDIRVIRTTTADVEKVQLRGHEVRTTEAGEEEVRGTVKNLSNVKADAVLVATFYDDKKETIGSKAIILRDIETNNIKQFHFKFKPQEGDKVRIYKLNVVCDIEEYK